MSMCVSPKYNIVYMYKKKVVGCIFTKMIITISI